MIQAPLFLSLLPPRLGLICWWKLDAGDAPHAGAGDAVNQKSGRFGSDRLCDEPDTHSGLSQDLWTQAQDRRFHRRKVGEGDTQRAVFACELGISADSFITT